MDSFAGGGAGAQPGPAQVPGMAGPGPDPLSDRMRALLSRATEDQLSEQRRVADALTDIRMLVDGLGNELRGTASAARLERLGGELATVSQELRASTSGLSERLERLATRVDDLGAERDASGGEDAAVAALAADLRAQSASVERVGALLGSLAPVLSGLQERVAGLDERLSVLAVLPELRGRLAALEDVGPGVPAVRTAVAELRASVDSLTDRSDGDLTVELRAELSALAARIDGMAGVDALRPDLEALSTKLAALGEAVTALPADDPAELADRLREGVVAALSDRLAALAPTSDPEVTGRLDRLDTRLAVFEDRLIAVAERISDIGDAAGGVPALSTDVAALRAAVSDVAAAGARTDPTVALQALREDVEDVGSRLADITPAPPNVVAQAVADKLVDALAPRVADVVLQRLGSTVAEQVEPVVRTQVEAATTESEQRLIAHVDEAVLALAEALLKRPARSRKTSAPAAAAPASAPGPVADAVASPAPRDALDTEAQDTEAQDAEAQDAEAQDAEAQAPVDEDAGQVPDETTDEGAPATSAEPPPGNRRRASARVLEPTPSLDEDDSDPLPDAVADGSVDREPGPSRRPTRPPVTPRAAASRPTTPRQKGNPSAAAPSAQQEQERSTSRPTRPASSKPAPPTAPPKATPPKAAPSKAGPANEDPSGASRSKADPRPAAPSVETPGSTAPDPSSSRPALTPPVGPANDEPTRVRPAAPRPVPPTAVPPAPEPDKRRPWWRPGG